METTENPNIFVKFIKSFTDFRIYNQIRYEKLGKSFGYLILLALALGIIFGAVVSMKTNRSIDTTIDFIGSDEVPDITIENGILNIDIDEPLVFTEGRELIFIVDMTDTYTFNDLAGYSIGYLITPERIIINQVGSPPVPFEFKDMEDFQLDKYTAIDILTRMKGMVVGFILFVIIVGTILLKLLESLIISIISLIANAILNTTLTYNELYKVSIYALTLPSLIVLLINSLTRGLSFGIMLLIYYGIATLIVVLALKNITPNDEPRINKVDDLSNY